MASQKYFCFKCRDNGFPNEEVVFSGKDKQGKTILKNPEDMTPHQHKQQQAQQQPLAKKIKISPLSETNKQTEYEKSVDRGISAFSMMTDLIGLVEQTQKYLVTMNEKLDRLLNLAERK